MNDNSYNPIDGRRLEKKTEKQRPKKVTYNKYKKHQPRIFKNTQKAKKKHKLFDSLDKNEQN